MLIESFTQPLLGITEVFDRDEKSGARRLDLGSARLQGGVEREARQFLLVLR